ncbi:aldose epimerase family protein [Phenylobacterium sp.]|uniref:aldose epimerase family protein n=1 Tax=Phenylobacterium sp. TaxID=1871053 RepID=UPI002717287B|nr:aldose epimerase family protein [Phenylobacterium sp.]MDO8800654.1 aldose epimerase family protein [Phenylobacterium sp.]
MNAPITMKPLSHLPDGRMVDAYTLNNVHGVSVRILTYGGAIQSIRSPDRDGELDDIVLGYDHLERYLESPRYFGCLVGRYAGRIARGQFSIDGCDYDLDRNEGGNCLHGGRVGLDKTVWAAKAQETRVGAKLTLTHVSPDGDMGFPGELAVQAVYELTRGNELRLEISATTTAPTVVNLTNHTYWNLGGLNSRHVRDHELQILAEGVLVTDEALVPTGEIMAVAGSELDYRQPRPLTVDLDHTFVLADKKRGVLAPAACLTHQGSGRSLQIDTTEPCLTAYTGWGGVALETQHAPDAPNHPHFLPTLLRPGVVLKTTTVFKLG